MATPELPDPSRSQVVLIGVSDHTDPDLPSYPALETGVREFARLLQGNDVWGVPESQCHIVTGEEATQERISEVLAAAAEQAEDALIVYYGGHGMLDRRGSSTRLLLAQREASYRHTLNWRDFDWLRSHLQHGSPMARHRILLLDSCHSGEAMSRGALNASVGNWKEDDRENLSTLITSCEKFERAQILKSERYSAFMSALIDTVATGVDGAGGALTPKHLWGGLKTRVGGQQTPRMLCADGAEALPLLKNRQHDTARPGSDSTSGKATIPLPPEDLIGRDTEIAEIASGARKAAGGEGPFVAVVHGRGGAGKSAIVQQAAAEVAADFPEWQLYVNLHTWTPGQLKRSPANLLEDLLYQAKQSNIPPDLSFRGNRWRDWLAENRALIVLDDVADTEQIREVLPPAGSRCAVLLTSRNPMGGLKKDVWFEADPLGESEAVELLQRGSREPLSANELLELANAVGRVPKALDVLRRQLQHMRPVLLLQRIKDAGSHALETIYRDSLRQLESEAVRRTAYACGFHLGPDFDAGSIAAITGNDEYATAEHLHELVEHRLIKALPHYRFQLHDEDAKIAPVIAMESDLDGSQDAKDRIISWLQQRVRAALRELWGEDDRDELQDGTDKYNFTGPGAANKWLNEASDEVFAAARTAIEIHHDVAIQLAEGFARWLFLTDRYDLSSRVLMCLRDSTGTEGRAIAILRLGAVSRLQNLWRESEAHYEAALHLARASGSLAVEADALEGLGTVARLQDRWTEGEEYYKASLNLARTTGNRITQASARKGLGDIARLQDRWSDAEEHYKVSLDIARATGNRIGQAYALKGLGSLEQLQGRWIESEELLQAALDIAHTTGDRTAQANTLFGLGDTARVLGRWTEAEKHYKASLKLAHAIGSRIIQAYALEGLGNVAKPQKRWTEAEDHYKASLNLARTYSNRVAQANALKALGALAKLQERWTEAEEHYKASLNLARSTGSRLTQAHTLYELGWLYKAQHQDGKAAMMFREARELYSDIAQPDWADLCQQALKE